MDSLLILGGLLLILAGLVWLVMRAFGTSLLWGWASLLPPLTLGYLFRHWKSARQPVGLCALGVIPLVVGLTMLASHDGQRLADILSLKWLKPEISAPAALNFALNGELNGQPFNPQQGELMDGVLTLREGQDFFARREVVIRLPERSTGAVNLDVLPTDTGPLPEIEISWLLPEQELPEARRVRHGYTLHLALTPLAPNKLVGDFHLVLPPQFKTTLSGKVELFSNGLRYVDGKVDRRIDSRDTLEFVIEDYLQRRFATREVQLSPLPVIAVSSSTLDFSVEALINGLPQQVPLQLVKSPSGGWSVKGDRYARLAKHTQAPVVAAPAEPAKASVAEVATRQVDRRAGFSLQALLGNPQRYQGLTMHAVTLRGSQIEGRFRQIDNTGRIVLRQVRNGAGEASFTLDPEQVKTLELLEP
ncbi:MFS transporter [Pseudomonas sp. EL_65y_Pfl2_R95]|uniref:MFS transporter n=1 Tax=Pseudomonas sp. EL_65y_Pfl2_R95 TaxID=3088698 RepID=UPI0030DD6A55